MFYASEGVELLVIFWSYLFVIGPSIIEAKCYSQIIIILCGSWVVILEIMRTIFALAWEIYVCRVLVVQGFEMLFTSLKLHNYELYCFLSEMRLLVLDFCVAMMIVLSPLTFEKRFSYVIVKLMFSHYFTNSTVVYHQNLKLLTSFFCVLDSCIIYSKSWYIFSCLECLNFVSRRST